MKRTYRLTAFLLALLMLVNLSATAMASGITLDELDIATYQELLAVATEEEDSSVLSEPCGEDNQYCALVNQLVAMPTAQERYEYMMGLYSEDAENVTLEGTMLHYYYYKAEHNAEGLVCECDFPSLAPEYQPGALNIHEADCPWTFANLSVAEQYSIVCLMTADEGAPYLATLSAEQVTALETYAAQQEEGKLSFPCDEMPEYCQFDVYSQMTATELYNYFNAIYADEDGEISAQYAAMMLHYGEYHLDSNLICTCGEHPLPLPEYQIGDVSVHEEDCPWTFANLSVAEQYTVYKKLATSARPVYMASLDETQVADLEDYILSQNSSEICDGVECGFNAFAAMSGADRHNKLIEWIGTEAAEMGTMYNVFINHVLEKHISENAVCVCYDYQNNYANLGYGSLNHVNGVDWNFKPIDCPWHFSMLPSEDKITVFGQMSEADQLVAFGMLTAAEQYKVLGTVDAEQKKELETKYPEATGKLENVNKTEQTVTSNGSEDEPSTDVAINVPQGAFDVDYIMNAAAAVLNTAQQAALDALQAMHQLAVFDISFEALANGEKLQPNVPVQLTFTVDVSKVLGNTLHVHHLKDNGDGTYTAESLGTVAVDKSQTAQTVTVSCPSFSSITVSEVCDGSCGIKDLLEAQDGFAREKVLLSLFDEDENGNLDKTRFISFLSCAQLNHKDSNYNQLICLCYDYENAPADYSYGNLLHTSEPILDYDGVTQDACHWHFSQIPSADQLIVFETMNAEDKKTAFPMMGVENQATVLEPMDDTARETYLGTLNDDQKAALEEYMNANTDRTLPTDNGSMSGKIPADAVAVMDSTTVVQALVNALVPADAFVEGTMTTKAYDMKLKDANGNAWMPTEPVTVQVNGIVDASWEEPLVAVIHLLDSAEAIAKEQAKGNVYTIEDAAIVAAFSAEATAAQAAGLGNVVAFTGMTSENGAVTVNADGSVTFQTNSFSNYYLVSGEQEDDGGNDTFHILRGTNVQLNGVNNNNYMVTYPDGITAANSGVVITRNNNTLTFTATENAAYGTYVIRVSSSRTATIYIHDPQELFELEEDFTTQNYWGMTLIYGFTNDVYFTVISDSSIIPSEPVSGGEAAWNYIKKSDSNYTFTESAWGAAGRYQTSPDGFLKLDVIAASEKLTQNMTGDNTIGVIDSGLGKDTLPCVTLTTEEWHKILVQFVNKKTVYISNGSGGRTPLTAAMVEEKLDDGKTYRYQMHPYVIKLIINGDSGQDGWHVDCCVVDTKTYSVSYEYNLPASAIVQESGDLYKPDTKFYSPGKDDVDVGVMTVGKNSTDYVQGDREITVYDSNTMSTNEYKFLYWNTQPDGSGTSYDPGETLPPIYENIKLYAIWDHTQTSGVVKISKAEIFEDEDDERKGRNQEYTFTVTITNAAEAAMYPYQIFNVADPDTSLQDGNFTSGGTLKLKHGEYAVISNIPAGAITVTETVVANAGYEPNWKVGDATSEGNSVTATATAGKQTHFECTNTYPPLNGSLKILKTLVDASNQSGTFTFTVTPKNGKNLPDLSSVTGVTVSNNVATVVMQVEAGSNASVTLPNLPMGEYEVAELNATNYDTTVQVGTAAGTTAASATVEVPAGDEAEVTFSNTRKLGDLKISKNVEGEYAPDSSFTFEVTLTGAGNVTYPYKVYNTADNTEVENGSGTIGGSLNTLTLKDGQYALIAGLPQGAQYSVQENYIPDGFEVTPATASGNISAATVAEAAFTNIHQVGSLTITKNVDGSPNDYFVFQIKQGSDEIMKVYIQGSGSTTISNLPAGDYTVTELESAWRYKLAEGESDDSKTVTVETGKTANVSFSNVHETDQWLDTEVLVDNKFN